MNAIKKHPDYYDSRHVEFLAAIDPLFPVNLRQHPSRGRSCLAGHTAFTVDGDGVARRCHFIKSPLGNIYQDGFEECLVPRPCTNAICGCHIGYVHLEELRLDQVFGEGLLERIPEPGAFRAESAKLPVDLNLRRDC